MIKNLPGEQWKIVVFDFEFSNNYQLEVSNFGRLRTHNKINKGALLKGSMIKGYKIVRLKFYSVREPANDQRFKKLQEQVFKLMKDTTENKKQLRAKKINPETIPALQTRLENSTLLLNSLKKNLHKDLTKDLNKRVIHYHSLVHRLVAEYFCKKTSDTQTIVAHLDFDKLNNRSNNLEWMTPKDNLAHQQKSPNVILSRANRVKGQSYNPNSKVNKLTITKVMLLKKLLIQGKPIKTLVKQFKITDTQILRIKRGENWGFVEAAK